MQKIWIKGAYAHHLWALFNTWRVLFTVLRLKTLHFKYLVVRTNVHGSAADCVDFIMYFGLCGVP